jgi:hypothetical protein
MRERELQRRRAQRRAMAGAHRLDAAHPLQDLRRRVGVPELGARHGAGGEDARGERGRERDRDAALDAERQQLRQRRRVEQRVAAREHEHVEIAVAREALEDPDVVDADTDRLDHALAAQAIEGAIRAFHRLAVARLQLVAGPFRIDVVDVRDVDARQGEPLQAVLERAQRAVMAVVVDDVERRRAREGPGRARGGVRLQQPPDLGREHEGVARHPAQARAQAMLRQAVAVERCRIEVAHARAAGRGRRLAQLRVGHLGEEIAERPAAEAERTDLQPAAADRAQLLGRALMAAALPRRLRRLCTCTCSPGSIAAVVAPIGWPYLRTVSPDASARSASLCPSAIGARSTISCT